MSVFVFINFSRSSCSDSSSIISSIFRISNSCSISCFAVVAFVAAVAVVDAIYVNHVILFQAAATAADAEASIASFCINLFNSVRYKRGISSRFICSIKNVFCKLRF